MCKTASTDVAAALSMPHPHCAKGSGFAEGNQKGVAASEVFSQVSRVLSDPFGPESALGDVHAKCVLG